MKHILIGLVALSFFTSPLQADVASYLERNPYEGTVVVDRGGTILFSQGAGDQAFQIGSITKIFTAIAVLQLQERGQLSVADPLSRYLDYPQGDRITLEHLLAHTSGIPDYFNEPASPTDLSEFATKKHSIDEVIALFRDRPLHFPPGSDYRYSNSNYMLLGRVVEVVSGQSYEDFVTSTTLQPLGLNDTGVGRNPPGLPVPPGKTAFSELPAGVTIDLSFYGPAGGMVSTADDLVRFGRALLAGNVLREESLLDMVRPRRGGYGLGWMVPRLPGPVVGGHTGRTIGYSAHFLVDKGKDLVVVLLAASDLLPTDAVGSDVLQVARRG